MIDILMGKSLVHDEIAKALAEGFEQHGIPHRQIRREEEVEGDLVIVYACKRHDLFARLREQGKHYLIAELGYLGDRNKTHFSLTFDGLNGHGVSADPVRGRGKPFYPLLQPFDPEGDYILFTGQLWISEKDCDASLLDLPEPYPRWIERNIPTSRGGQRVKFRPHPKAEQRPLGGLVASNGTLEQDLANASQVWTWNSTSAVDAFLAGKPVAVHSPGSVLWPWVAHDWRDVSLVEQRSLSRERVLDAIASRQWTLGEMRDGTAWDMLSPVYARLTR